MDRAAVFGDLEIHLAPVDIPEIAQLNVAPLGVLKRRSI
jgi:hypothetical protein